MFHGLVQKQSLRKLYLGGNKFTVTTIPAIVSTMENLVELSLSGLVWSPSSFVAISIMSLFFFFRVGLGCILGLDQAGHIYTKCPR